MRTQIQLAQFMMRSDLTPDLDVIIDAAASAMTMLNVALGEELARFAFDRGGGLPAALVLAEALSWQGRGDEAEAVLADVDPDGADEWLIVQWGCLRAVNLFFNCGQVEQARQVLANVKDRVDSEASRGSRHSSRGVVYVLLRGRCDSDRDRPGPVWIGCVAVGDGVGGGGDVPVRWRSPAGLATFTG